MENFDIYADIAERTGGDIYLGVVGPVRTGKSTFIKRFMETLVLDRIEDENVRERTIDELPQSADGKTIMTTEPKFVPNEAVRLKLNGTIANVRLIDCVGYLVDGALGHEEEDKPRLVHTPWSEEEIPFEQAAEMGTDRVIREHATIGVVVTTDGSITDLTRDQYLPAEERVVREMKEKGKPFTIVLNSKNPTGTETTELAKSLTERYGVPVIPMNVAKAQGSEFGELLVKILMEFPIQKVEIRLPKWIRALDPAHRFVAQTLDALRSNDLSIEKMRDYEKLCELFSDSEVLDDNPDLEVDSATGTVRLDCKAKEGAFYRALAEQCGCDITDDYQLMHFVVGAAKAVKEYDKIRYALESVRETGYGIVMPDMDEIELAEPELVKKGAQFGVRLRASAPSLHIMRVDVQTEISPIIGSEQQSEELVNSLLGTFENEKNEIWNTNMFGRPLSALVRDDLNAKIGNMPQDSQKKLRRTMTRIINEGRGGVLCILL